MQTAGGDAVAVTKIDADRISLPTRAGETYVVTEIPADGSFAKAPTGGQALRGTADQVQLTWNKVEGLAGATYTVERRVADGEFKVVAERLTETKFVDDKAAESAGSYTYRVSTVFNGAASKPSAPISVDDVRKAGIVDDSDPRVKYEGNWGNWTDAKHLNGTIKFIDSTSGGEKISLTFAGTGVNFISPKNSGFTDVDFYIDGKKVTETPYSLYSTTSLAQQEVEIASGLAPGLHTVEVVATGKVNPGAHATKLEFDAFRVLDGTEPGDAGKTGDAGTKARKAEKAAGAAGGPSGPTGDNTADAGAADNPADENTADEIAPGEAEPAEGDANDANGANGTAPGADTDTVAPSVTPENSDHAPAAADTPGTAAREGRGRGDPELAGMMRNPRSLP